MTKTTAKPIKGLTKECPACGTELQGKTNIYGNVFFRCDAHIDMDTGEVARWKSDDTSQCYYRENFGILASGQLMKHFEEKA